MRVRRYFGGLFLMLLLVAIFCGLLIRVQRYPQDRCLKLTLDLSPESMNGLRGRPKEDVVGFCSIEGRRAQIQSKIHLKGAASFEPIDRYPNFTVKLLEPIGDCFPCKFYLNNSMQDPSFSRDIAARHVFSSLGIAVPAAEQAMVRLNTNEYRPYVFAVGINRDFLESSFPDCEGIVYEGETTGCHPRWWPTNVKAPVALAEPPVDWFINSTADANGFKKFIAGEYLTSHSDGYLTSLNNYWVYRCSKHGECLMFPHTLDYSFRSSYWVLTDIPHGKAVSAVMRVPQYREQIKQLVRLHSRSESVSNVIAVLHTNRARFLATLGYGSIGAHSVCRAMETTERNILDHFGNIDFAFRAQQGQVSFTDDYRKPERWVDKTGNLLGMDSQARLTGPPSLNSKRYLQCYVLINPGAYRWSQPIESETPLDFSEIKLEIIGSGCQVIKSDFTVLNRQCLLSVDFVVTNSSSERLFELELARLRVTALHAKANVQVQIKEGILRRMR
jgi:hypothetical protein